MHKSIAVFATAFCGMAFTGCNTMSEYWKSTQEWYETQQLKRREAQENEYKRLAALQPAQVVFTPSRDIAICAQQSCDLFNVAQPKMRAYVALTENSYEYRGYINDVQYYIDEEKMSRDEAQKKVRDAVIAGDLNRPEEEKIWPKVLKGAEAARQFGTESESKQFLALRASHLEIEARLAKITQALFRFRKDLKKAEKNKQISKESRMEQESAIMQRLAECAAVQRQLSDAGKCISFMEEQCNRVREFEKEAAR